MTEHGEWKPEPRVTAECNHDDREFHCVHLDLDYDTHGRCCFCRAWAPLGDWLKVCMVLSPRPPEPPKAA